MTLSLKLRQGLVSIVLLLLLLPSSFIAIDQAFFTQLLTSAEQKLEVHMYAMLSDLKIIDGKIELSNNTLSPDFFRPDSGLSAYVTSVDHTNTDQIVWQSDSSLSQNFTPPDTNLVPGEHSFYSYTSANQEYWLLSIALLFDSGEQTRPLAIHIVQTDAMLRAPYLSFRNTLLSWFIWIGAALVILSILAYYWTTKPLSKLDQEIRKLEGGEQDHLNGQYPVELTNIKEDLNLLLANQNRQKQRYRNHLSDLAHALKTPVAVLKTSVLSEQPELKEQLDRISAMIEHQLKRASSSGQDIWKKQFDILPHVDKLCNALQKIYRDKDLHIQIECADNATFRGDETDLMEILGNLLDNACKACQRQVKLTVIQNPLNLIVEDDGPGIAKEARKKLFARGTRLDTYKDGHGVGLSIVAELVSSYSGGMQITDSPLGGARFELIFPE
ncbi:MULTISPECIES: ATP-binding protein [unclassified Arsukibacterium]|uniref:ATP-binding protein n=1 Tax=unclassified Arsukibacterium TaxID=2635278 RepID=UPI000C8E8F60|nr:MULTISPECIES: ATP-binding protein [unclassified Arsukibacterium]MAA96476.1 ATP-binding protein [Rheinheimera sp.]|tara:strand:- start:5549 stop:6874 length:1326 start_codon:yes stop_codon:yes gene_type:complete